MSVAGGRQLVGQRGRLLLCRRKLARGFLLRDEEAPPPPRVYGEDGAGGVALGQPPLASHSSMSGLARS